MNNVDLEFYAMAVNRLNKYDPSTLISEKDMIARFNITESDLAQADDVEFE